MRLPDSESGQLLKPRPLYQNIDYILLVLANISLVLVMPVLLVLTGLVGGWLAPVEEVSMLPAAVQMLAGFLAATPMSLRFARHGRKTVFQIGALLMVLGGIVGASATYHSQFYFMIVAHFLFGAALSIAGFLRFAGTELVSSDQRAQAISMLTASKIVSAFGAGAGLWFGRALIQYDEYFGAYLFTSLLGFLGFVLISFVKFPDDIAPNQNRKVVKLSDAVTALRSNNAGQGAIVSAIAAHGAMVFMMTPTSFAILGYGYSAGCASSVIQWHVIAMFLPGFFTGRIVSRLGGQKVAFIGHFFIMLSAVPAMLSVTEASFYVSLVLLGVGWNFAHIASSTLLVQAHSGVEAKGIQGINDALIAFFASLCSLASGFVLTKFGWFGVGAAVLMVPTLMFAFLRPSLGLLRQTR